MRLRTCRAASMWGFHRPFPIPFPMRSGAVSSTDGLWRRDMRDVQTLSAMAHFPMSVPKEFRTYEQYLATVDALHLGYEAMEQAFRRIAFNVGIDECDDHTKNFSFMLREGGEWTLAPAYDLTGSCFPSDDPWSAHGGCHQLSVNGKQSKITDDDLLAVADRFAIGTAPRVLGEVKSAL